MQHHKYSLTEIENMMPWERDIYLGLLNQYIEEENLKAQQRMQKMRGMISPQSVTNRVGSGLITAAKNSVTKIKESTQKISKVSDKDQKFVMNYVQFFGSKKTAKILKKSLESIKQSIVATLEIASTLKKFIGKASKMMKKRAMW